MEERPEPQLFGSTAPRSRWLALSPPGCEWLIIEHPDGQLEDLGFVETQTHVFIAELAEDEDAEEAPRLRLRWRTADDLRQGTTFIGRQHRDADGNPIQPYRVVMPDGSRQLWYLGREAHRKATDCGLLWTFAARHLA